MREISGYVYLSLLPTYFLNLFFYSLLFFFTVLLNCFSALCFILLFVLSILSLYYIYIYTYIERECFSKTKSELK